MLTIVDSLDRLQAEKALLEAVELGEHINQRQLSLAIGLSLGKTHYLLKELIERGLIKVGNFRKSRNKLGYAYLLTPAGVAEKVNITKRFLMAKEREYENLKREIQRLNEEIKRSENEVKP